LPYFIAVHIAWTQQQPGAMDARVVDYLDDKLQTLGDLDSLDSLLANIHTQHGLLKQQVRALHPVRRATWTQN
jgi:predicted RNase H-like nuclease